MDTLTAPPVPCTDGDIGPERREIECEPLPAPRPAEPAPAPVPAAPVPA
ncbi:hypothetical protein [Geodermatophilus sp. DSM 44513]|nr:hypothetical protein [Geodermatophilus sp. DSM 44513]WNV76821.1 hypothetical protein RTG05_05970 [Geodermatophilus sp. DSM 44513]